MSRSAYGKPLEAIPERRQLLESRGMAVSDPAAAERCPKSVGYYRPGMLIG